jgi:hypothetical protein
VLCVLESISGLLRSRVDKSPQKTKTKNKPKKKVLWVPKLVENIVCLGR